MLFGLAKEGKIDKKHFKKYLTMLYTSDNNIFEYLSDSEIAQLKARWPEEYWKNANNEKSTVENMLDILEFPRPNIDWKI